MPRKVFTSPRFNGGMILNADPSDLPEGFGVAALDTMVSLDGGSIGGRYGDIPSVGRDGVDLYAFISKESTPDTHELVYATAGDLKKDGTSIDGTGSYVKCITGHINHVLAGCGRTNPSLYYGYPNGSSTPILCYNAFPLAGVTFTKTLYVTHADGTNAFDIFEALPYLGAGNILNYAISIVYDGYMHGPLQKLCSIPITQPLTSILTPWDIFGGGAASVDHFVTMARLALTLDVPTSMTARVTKVILYRSVTSPGTNDANISSEYAMVKEFTSFTGMTFTEGNAQKSPTYIEPDVVTIGASYFENSGLDETVGFCNLGYEVAHEMNNFLFAGNVGYVADIADGRGAVQQLPDGSRMLYRSMRGRPGQFRIIDDYLALPFTPIAMTSFNNRLIVFGSAEFAIVNPEAMIVEDVIYGYGVTSQMCVHTTLHGVFFANSNNMFVYDGQQVTPLGTPVLRIAAQDMVTPVNGLSVYSYEQIVESHGGIKKVVYSARINSVLFLYAVSGSTFAFVFSLDSKTWSVSSFASVTPTSAYIDRANVLYIGTAAAMAFSIPTTLWRYITRRFTFGSLTQWKKIYNIYASLTNVYVSDDTYWVSLDGGTFVSLHSSGISSTIRRAKNLIMKFTPIEGDDQLSSIEITYREMLNTK
jgi:hypothetical protein